MISHGTHRGVIVLILAFACAAWCGEPKEAPIQLQFEISPAPLGPYIASGMGAEWKPFASYRPAYAVAIPLVRPIDWLPSPARGTMSEFWQWFEEKKYPSYAEEQVGLSAPQKAFLQVAKAVLNDRRTSLLMDRPDPNGPQRVLLYALTLDDAKKMAEGYFQYARNYWWRGYLNSLSQDTQKVAENYASKQERLVQIDKLIETSQKSLEQLQKTVLYRTEAEAQGAVAELDRTLTTAQVEIAGIKARITAIQGYQHERYYQEIKGANGETVRVPIQPQKTSPQATAKLDMMFIEESIALRGAQAREQMAARMREQANRFIELKSALTSAAAERKPLVESLESAERILPERQKRLEATRQQEPKIPGKVVIYPVKWVDEPSQN
jgi:hypothetical protein